MKNNNDVEWILIEDKIKKSGKNAMPIKKKKKKIIKSSTSKKQQRGLKNFSHGGFEKNPFIEAAKVKNYKQLKEFVELHTPALGPAGVAYAATEFVFKNYNTYKDC